MGTARKTPQKAQAELNLLIADVVSAYVSKNRLPASDVPVVIEVVHDALANAGVAKAAEDIKRVPPVPVGKTVTPDYIISLEDGRRYKTLRRHLSSRGLTPDEYRIRWGLPPDYPMIAKNYRAERVKLAHALGLGRKRKSGISGRRAG